MAKIGSKKTPGVSRVGGQRSDRTTYNPVVMTKVEPPKKEEIKDIVEEKIEDIEDKTYSSLNDLKKKTHIPRRNKKGEKDER